MDGHQTSTLKQHRILVTGASGFIGSHLVKRLLSLGASVTAISRTPRRLTPMLKDIDFVACDLRDASHLHDVVAKANPHIVFHLAAYPDAAENARQMYDVLDANVVGTANLLEALHSLPSISIIFGDSAKVFGNSSVPYRSDHSLQPLSSYAVAKVAAWGLIDVYRRINGFVAVGLRPTLVYGPGQGFNIFSFLIQSVQEQRSEIGLDGGSQTRDPLFIDDAVDAFIAAAENRTALNGLNLPIGGNREVPVSELAQLTVNLLGGGQTITCRPTHVRPTETIRSWCDNTEAKLLMNWSPKVTLEDGILRTAAASGLGNSSKSSPPLKTED